MDTRNVVFIGVNLGGGKDLMKRKRQKFLAVCLLFTMIFSVLIPLGSAAEDISPAALDESNPESAKDSTDFGLTSVDDSSSMTGASTDTSTDISTVSAVCYDQDSSCDVFVPESETDSIMAVSEENNLVTDDDSGVKDGDEIILEEPRVSVVQLDKSVISIEVGKSIPLSATVYNQFNEVMEGLPVSWASENTIVADVYENGLVTAASEGITSVTAACYGVEGSCEVTVEKARPDHIVLNYSNLNLKIGASKTVQAQVMDQFDQVMENQLIDWTIENQDIAMVDTNGIVTGKNTGKTSVTAACYGNSDIQASCPVNIFEKETNIVVISGTTGFMAPMVDAYHNLTEKKDFPYHFGLKVFLPDDLESQDRISLVQEAIQDADVVLLEMIGASRDNILHDIFCSCYEEKWQSDGQPQIFVQRCGEKDKDTGTWNTSGFITNIVQDLAVTVNKDDEEWTRINTYILNSGVNNWERLFLYLASQYGKGDVITSENLDPIVFPRDFVYHPAADIKSPFCEGEGNGDGLGVFANPEDYYAWYTQRDSYNPDAPWVGIIGYDSFYKNGDQELYIETLKAVEATGLNAILLYPSSKTRIDAVRNFFYRDLDHDGKKEPVIDVLICGIGFLFDSNTELTQDLFKEMNIPVLNPIYTSDLEKWEDNPAGAVDAVYWQVAQPELEGRIEPVIMGGTVTLSVDEATGAQVSKKMIIPDRIERLAGRAWAWAKLHRMENEDKKVAVLYYNLDGGKDGITASYLNVPRSLTEILKAMKDAGYNVDPQSQFEDTEGKITEEKIFEAMFNKGRNIGGWAPGELDRFTDQEGIIRLSLGEYMEWFNRLPENLRKDVEEEWGPAPGKVMVQDGEIILPGVMTGNIFFGPQPMRGWGEDVSKITHSATLPPTHQYLAFYFWLQNGFQADAVVHLGTHGTAEWLPGKSVGLSGECWPDIVQRNMPNIYPYIVNNPGEATQAKRRGYAVTIDHLTAALANTELYGALLELHNLTHQYEFAIDPANNQPPEEAEKLKVKIIQLIESDGLDEKLDIDLEQTSFMDLLNTAHDYLHDLEADVTPLGLHTFGVAPEGQAFDDMVEAIINYAPEARQAIEDEILESLARTTEEIDMLLLALNAGFIPPGLGTDPVRNPDVMPTGRNIKSFDPRTVPEEKVAWKIGKKSADDLLEAYYAEHGSYPESVGTILWAIETMRTEGQSIAMVMRLMGIEPVWSSKGYVQSYQITPIEELGRPRIDVVITTSGLFRDTFSTQSELLDQAVRELVLLDEGDDDNYLKKHYDTLKEELISQGKSASEAEFLAGSRVFGPAPEGYGVGLSERMSATESWDTSEDLADVYLTRMGYIYGKDQDGSTVYGQADKELLTSVLKNVQAVVQVRDSIYGALDNDDVAQYLGGLVLASQWASGKNVDAYIANTRLGINGLKIQTFETFVSQELDSRLLNPKFVEEMLKEGYAGSTTIAKWFGNVFFIDATTGAITDKAWQNLAKTYVYDAAVRDRLDPYALQSLIGYTLEAARKGMWEASDEDLNKLSNVYMETMVDYGVVCCHHTCNNIVFNEWLAQYSSVDNSVREKFEQTLAEATKKDVNIPREQSQSTNKSDKNKKTDKLEPEELAPVEDIKPEFNPQKDPVEKIQEKPAVVPDTKTKMPTVSAEATPITAGEEEEKPAVPASASAGVDPKEKVQEIQGKEEKPEDQPVDKEVRAYEINKKENNPVTTGAKAVSAIAILGALGIAMLFFKGYISKQK